MKKKRKLLFWKSSENKFLIFNSRDPITLFHDALKDETPGADTVTKVEFRYPEFRNPDSPKIVKDGEQILRRFMLLTSDTDNTLLSHGQGEDC